MSDRDELGMAFLSRVGVRVGVDEVWQNGMPFIPAASFYRARARHIPIGTQ